MRLKYIEQNGNLYFTSSSGIKKISSTDAPSLSSALITNAGGIKGLDFQAVTAPGPGWLTSSNNVSTVGDTVTGALTGTITAVSVTSPTVITSVGHKLFSGDIILISGSNCSPSINGSYPITVVDKNTFTIPVNVTSNTSLSGTITGNTAANPTVVTSTAHGLSTGKTIVITGSNSTPSINGTFSVTVIDANTFSIPVNVTTPGTLGSWTASGNSGSWAFAAGHSNVIYNIPDTSILTIGYTIVGSGIPSSTTITQVLDSSTIKISNPATITAPTVALNSATNSVVGYRVLWGIKDANTNLILGSPSSIGIVRNTNVSSSANVSLTITIPKGVTTAHFYQIYRTPVLNDLFNNQLPGDEQQLVFESNPLQSDITNGYVTVLDNTPETFRAGGANLYTNQNSGEGILQANDLPPLAKDVTSFKGYTFYSNTQTLQRLNLALLSVSKLVSYFSGTITSNTLANPTVVTSTAHGLSTGRIITISGSNSTPSINGSFTVTVIDANTFSIPVNVTVAGSAGTWVTTDHSTFTTTDGTTTNVYSFAQAEDIVNKRILISSAATPSQQVDATARSLVRVVNRQSSEIVYAYYLSGPSDVPGLILLEARTINQSAFRLTCDNATTTGVQFHPTLPISGSSVISDNEIKPNRLYYSKFQQPESVPILNNIDVGPKDKAILRILALRDNLFILKEDGVYRLSGQTSAQFTVYPFDFSVVLKAPDSAAVLNNLIYLYSSQGISTISDTGIAVISRPIEDTIAKYLIPAYTNFGTSTFGVAYETDRTYYLFTVSSLIDTQATQCLRYNTFTQTWVQSDLSKRCGIVSQADDKLYLGPNDTNFIEQERKAFDRTDYSDRELSLTLGASAVSGVTVILPSVSNVTVGDVLTQTQYLTISGVNRLLSKLDRDSKLTAKNYATTYSAIAGVNLSTLLDSLITAISTDAGRVAVAGSTSAATYTALTPTGASFINQQTNFNAFVALLNADPGVGYKNYPISVGTTLYEFNIMSVVSANNSVTSQYAYPLILGPVVIYNHINVVLQWTPQFFQDVSMTKHVSEGTLIFEDSNFSSATLSYSTDLSANFEDQSITGYGNGIYGNVPYGTGLYGGSGSGVPFRTYLPKEKQRNRYVNVKFSHSIARESFALYGLSLAWSPISQRGWR